jgi:hypothetical protein
MNSGAIVGIFLALFTVAIVAVIVSQRAQTAAILQALGQATASSIGAATAPVTGGGSQGSGK